MWQPRCLTILWASTSSWSYVIRHEDHLYTEVHQYTFPPYATVASVWIPHRSHFTIIPMSFRIFVTSPVEKRRYLPRINKSYKGVKIMPWSRTARGCTSDLRDHFARRRDLFEGLPLPSHQCRNSERLCMPVAVICLRGCHCPATNAEILKDCVCASQWSVWGVAIGQPPMQKFWKTVYVRRSDLFVGLPLASHLSRNSERLCMICTLNIPFRCSFCRYYHLFLSLH
jgi:hypothetical protein